MSSTLTTGFCRVTVVAPDSRIDVALPDDVAVADLLPEILRLTGQVTPPGAPPATTWPAATAPSWTPPIRCPSSGSWTVTSCG